MNIDLTYNELSSQNKELQKQIATLKQEVELLRKTLLSNENFISNRFFQIIENVNDVVYRYNIVNHRYEYLSDKTNQLFGYSPESFIQSPWFIRSIIHPDSLPDFIEHWRNILAGSVSEYIELKITHSDGSARWVMQKNNAVKDDDDNVIAIEGIVSDITDKKNAEERLIESEAQKKAILNNLPHLAWLKSCDGQFLSVNESFAVSVNRTPREIIGKTDFDIYDQIAAQRYTDEDKMVVESRKQLYIEAKVDDKVWETFKAPIFNSSGEVIGVTGIALEISKRKKNEEEIKEYSEKLAIQNVKLKLINDELSVAKEKAEEADRLKSAFLANMSHEIRTPMNAILGFATLMRDRKLPDTKQTEFINLININGRQLLNIISDIIDISKIEANQITIFNKNFNINKTLMVLKQNFENQINSLKKPIELRLVTPLPDDDAFIFTDKLRMEQVLSNLLNNAVKFTDKGYIELGYKLNSDDLEIIFYVKDSGIGLTLSEQEVIFERFRQVSSSYNKLYGGTGLGLSISRGLVEKLGGRIWVESEVVEGSTFFVGLPFSHGHKPRPEKILFAAYYDWQGKTILIAEDEKTNYSLLENIIAPTNARIIWVKNGMDAIEACQANNDIDLVLMDIKMPDMNGLEATKRIRKMKENLPIIAQTAFATPNDEDNCLRAGCNDYLAKPLGIDEILMKINKYIFNYSKEKGQSANIEAQKRSV
jgi:PAS domain S-box-containing protein